MSEPIISKKTLYDFQEQMVSDYVLREIDAAFDSAGLSCAKDHEPGASGVRRTLIQQYYHTINIYEWEDCKKLLRVFEDVLGKIENRIRAPEGSTAWFVTNDPINFDRLKIRLKHDGFIYHEGKITTSAQVPSLMHLQSIALTADFPYLLRQLDRIESSIDDDPWLAIGTAKELIETICKSILTELNIPFSPTWDLMKLCGEAREQLKLTPKDIPNTNKAADTIKRLLGNLATIVQGLAELRNPYGTGHGHEGRARGLKPRHARLAAGAASTLALFLLETHRDAQAAAKRSPEE